MRFREHRAEAFRQRHPRLTARSWAVAVAGLAMLAVFPGSAGFSQQDEKPMHDPSGLPPANPLANPKPDANRIMEYSMQRVQDQKRIEQLNVLRQKEMTEDTKKLVRLAKEVESETKMGTSDSLSVLELRKVEMIEKLARGVREKMKTTVTTN